MNQMLTSADPLLLNVVLLSLAVGLPILLLLAIRFLWDRNLQLGRSKELEKLIWQLHRIATAMEHQMNLSFPAVQPGTEEARDMAYLQPIAEPQNASPASVTAPGSAARATAQPQAGQPAAPKQVAQPPATATPGLQEPSPDPLRQRAGVNSMFGL
ncbi:MAG TPA: hypothetical protein VL128_13485 [Candidatus Eisenbacteria bacterium]|nr:hypothetical protein [Candidatus Eisenbacteria bacterium]